MTDGQERSYLVQFDGFEGLGGLLPRTTPVGKIPVGMTYMGVWDERPEEECPIIPKDQWATSPTIRPYRWRFIDQNGYPACCLAALCNAVELLRSLQGRSQVKIDWEAAWRALSGGSGGVALDAAISYAMTTGLPLEGGGRCKVTEAWEADSLEAFASGLQRGCTGVLAHDVHAEAACSLIVDSQGTDVDTCNSWYSGDKDWHRFPLNRIEYRSYGLILVRAVEILAADREGMPDGKP